MIINVDSRPEDNIYFIAAMLINILKSNDYNIMNLYNECQKNNKTSFSLYILSLDWLQLLGVVEIKNNKCVLLKC